MLVHLNGIGRGFRALRGDFAPAGGAIAALALAVIAVPAAAKTPGAVHCYGGLCHRVASIGEMDGMVGRRGFLKASFYDHCARDRFNPCGLTSSGAVFRADLPDNAASPIFPDGTVLLVYSHTTRRAAAVRVTSTGPYWGDRKLDLSRAAAERLGFVEKGVATLEISVLKSPEPEEARYSKLRSYAPVPGYLGQFETFEAAQDAAVAGLRLETNAVRLAAIEPEVVFPDMPQFEIAPRRFPANAAISEEVEAEEGVRLSARVPVPPVLKDTPPLRAVAAVQLGEEDLRPAFLVRLSAFVQAARVKAKLSALPVENDTRAMAFHAPGAGFSERVAAFVRAAQIKARLSASRHGDVLAAR